MSSWRRVVGLSLLLLSLRAHARGDFTRPDVLVSATANIAYVSVPFSLPLAVEAQVGWVAAKNFYLGVGGDYWLASETTSSLRYLGLCGEAGFFSGNPRVFFLLTAAVFYPAILQVQGAGSTVYASATTVPLSYRARLLAGMRLTHTVALLLGGGYRLQSLGNLTSSGTSYNGGALDMTGLFFTAGLSLTL